ncbi:hypothetical protein D9613_006052 [Agrocybe pediades]|uniref:DUF6534 domain-containing protein n=1 Tax=Agrocybe pediades TaxID=84607 RepID=A0A8H4QVQ4_9AGAR|nr:hypothetical protein D9613_006052 [Agrocybe pediades]
MSSLDNTYGAAFLGLIGSAILYGVTVLQTQYPNDSRWTKFLVFFLWLLDTAHLILCTIAIYTYLVTNFANPSALGRSIWSMNLQTDCNGLIGLIVECFFARRVWRRAYIGLLKRPTYLIIPNSVKKRRTDSDNRRSFLYSFWTRLFTVEGFVLVEVSKFPKLIASLSIFLWVTSTGLGSAAASDVIIAISLCYYLTKSRTGFARTDSLITTLIIYSLTTGLITSIIAFICVVTFAIMPTNYIWLGFFWLIGKCYVNSLLAALNSREALREQVAPKEGTFLQLTPFRAVVSGQGEPPSPGADSMHKESRFMEAQSLAVNVQTQTVTRTDYEYTPSTRPVRLMSCHL